MSTARTRAERAWRLAWLAVAVYLVALGVSAVLRVQGDFNIYYRAGARVLSGEQVYRLGESNHFLYAPVFAIAFAPLAALPLKAAQGVWYLINAAALVALLIGASRMLFGGRLRPSAVLLAVPLIVSARFVGNNIEHGQINLTTLALTVWAVILGEEGHGAWAGLMLAAALLTKPYASLAALFLALERKWKPLTFTAGAAALLLVMPVVVFGPSRAFAETYNYVLVVASMAGRYRTMLTNQSAVSALARLFWFANPLARLPLVAGTIFELAIVAATSLWFVRYPGERGEPMLPGRYPLAALFCMMPSLAPVSWKSYYAALLVPYTALISALWVDRKPDLKPPRSATGLLILSVIINWIPGKRANRIALFYSVHFLSSLLLLAALAIVARWNERVAQVEPASGRIARG